MPNGEQEQDPEGEASGGESGEWHSDGEGDEESDDPSDEEEVESPPRRKGDPNLLTTRRAPMTRRPFRPGSRQSVLGRPLRHQLKKLQSSPRL